MKGYTDLNQSKKLAEILPLESADMYWLNRHIDLTETKYEVFVVDKSNKYVDFFKSYAVAIDNNEIIPCWSLAALLQVSPLGIYDEFDNCDYELEIDMIDKMPRYIRLGDIYHSQFPYDFEKDTLLDNIVESIIWLNDNNYFEL